MKIKLKLRQELDKSEYRFEASKGANFDKIEGVYDWNYIMENTSNSKDYARARLQEIINGVDSLALFVREEEIFHLRLKR